MLEVFQDAFPFFLQYPFVHRNAVEVSEEAAESGSGISAQMCKFFHVLHFGVVLHDKVMETFRVGADRVEERFQLGQGIVIGY